MSVPYTDVIYEGADRVRGRGEMRGGRGREGARGGRSEGERREKRGREEGEEGTGGGRGEEEREGGNKRKILRAQKGGGRRGAGGGGKGAGGRRGIPSCPPPHISALKQTYNCSSTKWNSIDDCLEISTWNTWKNIETNLKHTERHVFIIITLKGLEECSSSIKVIHV